MDLTGKWVWITGASSGIGKALAIAYAKTGCNLLLSARNEAKLDEVKALCTSAGQVQILPLDLSDISSSISLAKPVLKDIGPIHTLINNAGISQRALVKDTDLSVVRSIMEINYFAVVELTKLVLPDMLKTGEGQFIAMSSLVGKFGSPLRSTYAASKHALHGFYDSLRAEHHKDNIQVLLVCPGFIKTDISINAVTGTGAKQNKMDDKQAKGMSPDALAQQVLRAVRQHKEEVVIGGTERFGVLVKRLFPRIFSRIIRNTKVT